MTILTMLARRGMILLLLALLVSPAYSQTAAPCGVVNAIDYPLDISDTLDDQYDDFGRYRERFGGLHVGLDIAFRRLGEPVYAAARGIVTYADPDGWDTEKGVVILEHSFPDGSTIYTLYGHMEETDTVALPPVGACIERGQVVGTVGWPSRGLPHLHYEIRNFMPFDGGPGYVQTNPLLQGWYHPLDFTELWRLRLQPGFLGSVSLTAAPQVPPVLLESGTIASTEPDAVTAIFPPDNLLWRVTTGDEITGLGALPGDRLAAQTDAGDVITLDRGRYVGLWEVADAPTPLTTLGDSLIFLGRQGNLTGYDPTGSTLWSLDGSATGSVTPLVFKSNGSSVAVGLRAGGDYLWRLLDASGAILDERRLAAPPQAVPGPDGSWYLLSGSALEQVTGSDHRVVGTLERRPGRSAQMAVDALGNLYVYLDDSADTLLSIGLSGEVRWQVEYPGHPGLLPPLLDAGGGCSLYALDADGTLNVINAGDGQLIRQVALYTGGERTGNPRARLLDADVQDRVLVGAGFLSLVTLDGKVLSGDAGANCLLG